MLSDILKWLASLSAEQITFGLILVAGIMVALEERRLSTIALLLQYLLLALFLANWVYLPIAALKGLMGNPICLILYISARRVERTLKGDSRSPIMASPFRIVVVALGGVAAYGLWRAYPLGMLPPTVNLASYWLMIVGVLLIATSEDPLRTGLGLLTFANGFEVAYTTLDSSLIVVALLGSIDILIALAIAHAAERWIRAGEETYK